MKTESQSALFTILFVGSILIFPLANAEGLDLSSGDAQIVDSNTLSLHNIALDNRFYNAEIELNLDGTYRVKSVEQAQISNTARFEVVFVSTWSAATHPYQYPNGLSHFSGLVGATHKSNIRLWRSGESATSGIESMAETGGKSVLINEINSAIAEGNAETLISGRGLGSSPGTVSLTFDVTQSNSFVTLVSMIAPSPDWFIGVSAVSLIEQGQWVEELEIQLYAYDTGTDSGINYIAENNDTNPKGVITRIQDQPFLVDQRIPSLGSFTFKRLSE